MTNSEIITIEAGEEARYCVFHKGEIVECGTTILSESADFLEGQISIIGEREAPDGGPNIGRAEFWLLAGICEDCDEELEAMYLVDNARLHRRPLYTSNKFPFAK